MTGSGTGAEELTRRLAQALCDGSRFPHPAGRVERIETHISYVLLAGEYAYKIKKPLELGFLDFSTLAARRACCEEELRLNRRTAPDLYLAVLPIGGTHEAPLLGGPGEPIEYCVQMRAFPQDQLLDRIARRGGLGPAHADTLATRVAAFHATIAPAPPESGRGGRDEVLGPALQNFDQIEALPSAGGERRGLEALRAWTLREYARREAAFERRRLGGRVRECHGDLHLGNIALVGGEATPFDAIEFNPTLRWIDVMSDVAFLVMDLLDHRLDALAWRFLDGWLAATGDYDGLQVLPFYLAYRAMVRAKVACLRAAQDGASPEARATERARFGEYLALAERMAQPRAAGLAITFGPSGSGKTTLAAALVERLGAVRLRSDVERKRLAGLAARERSGSALDTGLYAPAVSRATYERLLSLADGTLGAGYPVVVDATFMRRADRFSFRRLAARRGVPFAIAVCESAVATLRERVAQRAAAGADASDATVEVLERQLEATEPLEAAELACAVRLDSAGGGAGRAAALEWIARRLAKARPPGTHAGSVPP